MKKYDSYKDSGIEWIGEIPSHWEVKRIRHIADIYGRIGYRGYTVSDIVFDESGAISLSPSNIENQKLNLKSITRITLDKYEESPEIKVFENDVILVKTASVGKATIVSPLNDLATINPQLVVFKNYRINQKFFYYEIISKIIQEQINQDLNGGVVNTITQTSLNNYTVIVPSKNEQSAIATYLDQKTSEIDRLIADKEELLKLYEEEKTAVINQAVTKGINPKVKMKDSGIEWLGEIPEHWGAVNLKWISKIYSGGTPSRNINEYWQDGTIPWLNSGTVNQFFIKEPSEYITEIALNNSSAKWIPENSILIALAGQGKTKGMVAQVLFKCTCNQSMGIIVPNEKIENRFLLYYLKNNYQNIRNLGGGDKRDGINLEMIGGISIPLVPLKEQQSIVDFIESETTRIDAKIEDTQKLIELLKEYRTALISEVVTGKVKVIQD
ncbi:MAG: restriction endonuclease subunit S [Moheibacter sp.]